MDFRGLKSTPIPYNIKDWNLNNNGVQSYHNEDDTRDYMKTMLVDNTMLKPLFENEYERDSRQNSRILATRTRGGLNEDIPDQSDIYIGDMSTDIRKDGDCLPRFTELRGEMTRRKKKFQFTEAVAQYANDTYQVGGHEYFQKRDDNTKWAKKLLNIFRPSKLGHLEPRKANRRHDENVSKFNNLDTTEFEAPAIMGQVNKVQNRNFTVDRANALPASWLADADSEFDVSFHNKITNDKKYRHLNEVNSAADMSEESRVKDDSFRKIGITKAAIAKTIAADYVARMRYNERAQKSANSALHVTRKQHKSDRVNAHTEGIMSGSKTDELIKSTKLFKAYNRGEAVDVRMASESETRKSHSKIHNSHGKLQVKPGREPGANRDAEGSMHMDDSTRINAIGNKTKLGTKNLHITANKNGEQTFKSENSKNTNKRPVYNNDRIGKTEVDTDHKYEDAKSNYFKAQMSEGAIGTRISEHDNVWERDSVGVNRNINGYRGRRSSGLDDKDAYSTVDSFEHVNLVR